jgi:hypothetical protein
LALFKMILQFGNLCLTAMLVEDYIGLFIYSAKT